MAKTEFVSLASHQLRTPLTAINWYAELLETDKNAKKLNEDQHGYIKEIASGSKRMVDLVEALLNVSRLDLGTFTVDPVKTDLVKLVKDVINEQLPTANSKKQKISTSFESKIPTILVDQNLVRILFQNLISNAIKYTPEKGSIEISMKRIKKGSTIISSKSPSEGIVFSTIDNGFGIPKGQQKQIFDKLFRADNIRDKVTDGTGLGLYIVKKILDESGGIIDFTSKENKGSTFAIFLPISGMKAKSGTKKLTAK